MALLGTTSLDVFPLCFGGNVFGWTVQQDAAFEILDAYAAAGGNFIDTADMYNSWLPDHPIGESETIIGNWMQARGNRSQMIIATKVCSLPSRKGLSASNIAAATQDCLDRLQTDYVDVLYAHRDDLDTPMLETMTAFDTLVQSGKVRYLGASNFTAERLQESLDVSAANGLAAHSLIQNHYNLMFREEYEHGARVVADKAGIAHAPYYGLASGFLTGKYRPGVDVDSPRAAKMLDERGLAVLTALDAVAATHEVPLASVALAWLYAQPTIGAPIASARTIEQLNELLPMATLTLTSAELDLLTKSSEL